VVLEVAEVVVQLGIQAPPAGMPSEAEEVVVEPFRTPPSVEVRRETSTVHTEGVPPGTPVPSVAEWEVEAQELPVLAVPAVVQQVEHLPLDKGVPAPPPAPEP